MPSVVSRASSLQEADSPGGSGASPINLLTSISDGLASGAIPSNWMSGVCWDPVGCEPSCVIPHSCDPLNVDNEGPIEYPVDDDGLTDKPFNDSVCATAYPFDIAHGLRDDCKRDADALLARARAGLAANTGAKIANYLSVSLTQTAEVLPGDECVPLETALGLLFNARAATGAGGGVIHIPDILAGVAQKCGLIQRGGARYTSVYGAPVIVGPGLLNLDPTTGLPPTDPVAWLYVTGPVDYAVSPIETLTNSVSWDAARQNDIRKVLVERRAIVRHDPCNAFAVCVALPGKDC